MSEHQDEEKDLIIPPIRADQCMHISAIMICEFINSFAKSEDPLEDKTKKAQILFTLFVRQLASFSKHKATMASLLRIVANEIDELAKNEKPVE